MPDARTDPNMVMARQCGYTCRGARVRKDIVQASLALSWANAMSDERYAAIRATVTVRPD